MIEIKEIQMSNKKMMYKFIRFPHKLFKDVEQYVPTLDIDEYAMLTPKKNGAFEWCEARYWLAFEGKEIVGRIGAILNHKYNAKVNKEIMRITRFDFIDNFEVSSMLVNEVKKWAKERNCVEMIGPIGFSDMDKEGMLIRGFEETSIYITLWNFPYYVEHMEKMGFEKENDWVEYRIKIPEKIDERVDRIANMSLKKFGYHIKYFKTKKEIYPYIHKGLNIMNEVYAHLLGYTELSPRQMDEFVDNFKLVLNTDYLFAVESKDGDLIGYGFFAPSLSRAMKKCGGKLTLSGISAVLHDLKKNDTVDLYSIGVRPEYMSQGVNAIILNEGIKACIKHGIKYAETGPELDINEKVQSQWKGFEYVQHKQRRCWRLPLVEPVVEDQPKLKKKTATKKVNVPAKKSTTKKSSTTKRKPKATQVA